MLKPKLKDSVLPDENGTLASQESEQRSLRPTDGTPVKPPYGFEPMWQHVGAAYVLLSFFAVAAMATFQIMELLYPVGLSLSSQLGGLVLVLTLAPTFPVRKRLVPLSGNLLDDRLELRSDTGTTLFPPANGAAPHLLLVASPRGGTFLRFAFKRNALQAQKYIATEVERLSCIDPTEIHSIAPRSLRAWEVLTEPGTDVAEDSASKHHRVQLKKKTSPSAKDLFGYYTLFGTTVLFATNHWCLAIPMGLPLLMIPVLWAVQWRAHRRQPSFRKELTLEENDLSGSPEVAFRYDFLLTDTARVGFRLPDGTLKPLTAGLSLDEATELRGIVVSLKSETG